MVSLDHPLAQDALNARTKAVSPGAEVGTPAPTKNYPTTPTKDSHSYLYVAVSGDFAKIGFAANLRIRLSNMRVDNPHGVEIAFYRELPKAFAAKVEKYCHVEWLDRCVTGEWHRGTAAEAIEMVDRVQKFLASAARAKYR